MSDLATRLRAAGVSEQRLYQINLATRAADVTVEASPEEMALAHEYDQLKAAGDGFAAAKIRERNPAGLVRGRNALRRIDGWLDANDVKRKHGLK